MQKQDLPVEEPIIYEEKKVIRRLSFKRGIADFLDAWNVERGLIYTIKWLFINPGKLARGYLGSERYKLTSPFRLLVLSTAVTVILTLALNVNHDFYKGIFDAFEAGIIEDQIDQLYNDYYNFILWFSVPLYALITLIFVKRKLNYIEHMVIYTYYTCLSNILYLIFIPLILIDVNISIAYIAVSLTYFIYMYTVALDLRKWHHFIRVALAFLLGSAIYFIFIAILIGFYLASI